MDIKLIKCTANAEKHGICIKLKLKFLKVLYIAQEISQRSECVVRNCMHNSNAVVRLCTRLHSLIPCTCIYLSYSVCYLPSFR